MRWFLLMAMAVSCSASAGPKDDVCNNMATTVEAEECTGKEAAKADATMERYLEAAKAKLKKDGEAIDLDKEQAAWKAYRDAHCGNVYQYWSGGSIRTDKAARCMRHLALGRTRDIWRAYLTYADSTPPVLPEPR